MPPSDADRPRTEPAGGPVPTDPAAVRAEIEGAVDPGDLAGIHDISGTVYVSVPLGREEIADGLVARHGDLVRVDVGGIPLAARRRGHHVRGMRRSAPGG